MKSQDFYTNSSAIPTASDTTSNVTAAPKLKGIKI